MNITNPLTSWLAAVTLLLSLLCANSSRAESLVLEIYPTYFQAHEVAAAVAPLLEEPETLTAHGNQLIIRAKDSTHDKILALLNQIDRPPRQLLVSVRPRQHQPISSNQDVAEQSLSDNDGIRIAKTQRPDEIIVYRGSNLNDRIEVQKQAPRLYSTRSDALLQQIRLEEGKPGWLPAGERWVWQLLSGEASENGAPTDQDNVRTGFYLRALIDKRGDIALEITEQVKRRDDVVEKMITDYETLRSFRVAPGTWVPLKALTSLATTSANNDSAQIHYRTQGARPGQQALDIRVDILD